MTSFYVPLRVAILLLRCFTIKEGPCCAGCFKIKVLSYILVVQVIKRSCPPVRSVQIAAIWRLILHISHIIKKQRRAVYAYGGRSNVKAISYILPETLAARGLWSNEAALSLTSQPSWSNTGRGRRYNFDHIVSFSPNKMISVFLYLDCDKFISVV